jgi:magnesium transporter
MRKRNYLTYILNPLELLRTKKVLQVNPTVQPERREEQPSRIFVFDYDSVTLSEKEITKVRDCATYIETQKTTWLNIDGLRKAEVEAVCNQFGIHYLVLEDILSVGQRAKMDEVDGILFCLLNMLYFNEADSAVEAEQISIVLGKGFVISFQEDAHRDVFNSLRDRLRIPGSKLRQAGPDFLFYALIDMIVDHYFLVMEKVGERVEELEEDIVRNSNKRSLAKINMLRKEMILLKRSIAPVREMINGILRSDSALINDRTERYFKDIYDHIIQANDLAENYRDMMMNLQDLYLSNVNLKMNEVMKVMTVVTCLLAPATVIGGIFGMNFDSNPIIHNEYGFFIAVFLMLLIPVWMIIIFKRRGWF